MSLQLLVNSQGSDCLEAKEKVHVIGNRLKLLLKEVTRDLRELAKILDITSSQQVYSIRFPYPYNESAFSLGGQHFLDFTTHIYWEFCI